MFSKIYYSNHKYASIIFHNSQAYRFFCSHSRLKHTLYNFKLPNSDSPFTSQNRHLNPKRSQGTPPADWSEVVTKWYKQYKDFVGITEILEAQEHVTLLTNQIFTVQSNRRRLQKDVDSLHQQLLETHQKITKSELYSEDHYFFFEKARELSSKLREAQTQSSQAEEEERILFTRLSAAIQSCHKKERAQSENSKYWSLLISIVSATLASLITSINNWVRIKEIKDHSFSLHKDNFDKIEHLNTAFSNFVLSQKGNDSETGNIASQALLETIRCTLREEVNQLGNILEGSSVKAVTKDDKDASATVSLTKHDLSYVKISLSLITSALIGSLVTIYFGGSIGGTS